jgi:hypothetical protein
MCSELLSLCPHILSTVQCLAQKLTNIFEGLYNDFLQLQVSLSATTWRYNVANVEERVLLFELIPLDGRCYQIQYAALSNL